MARGTKRVRGPWWILLLIILAGAMLGSILAESLGQFTYLAPLGHNITVGITPPVTLDLRILAVTLGFSLRLNLAVVLGIIAAVLLFRAL